MKYSSNRGFTLIELLVVIAIIGILSSVVLASLNTARNKGNDAAAKSNLNGTRSQAELWYDNNSLTYNSAALSGGTNLTAGCATAGTIFTDPNITQAINAAQTASGKTASCLASSTSWAIGIQLRDGNYFCIDGTGNATTTTTNKLSVSAPLDGSCN